MYVGMEKRIVTAQRLRLANPTKRYIKCLYILSDDRSLAM